MSNVPNATSVTDFGQYAKLRADARAQNPEALKQAAKQFEAMFTQQLLKAAHSQDSSGDLLGGADSDVYRDLYDQQMAMQISSGKGLGLADMLVNQLRGIGQPAGATPVSGKTAAAKVAAIEPDADWQPQSAGEFVAAVRPHAEKAAAELGVPARVLIAQAALETGWGKHLPKQSDGSNGFNLFGVKAGSSWSGNTRSATTSEFDRSGWSQQTASFRSYGSISHSFDDYVSLLKNSPRYAKALNATTASGFAQGLQNAGYATDPDYAQKIMKVANSPEMTAALSTTSTVTV